MESHCHMFMFVARTREFAAKCNALPGAYDILHWLNDSEFYHHHIILAGSHCTSMCCVHATCAPRILANKVAKRQVVSSTISALSPTHSQLYELMQSPENRCCESTAYIAPGYRIVDLCGDRDLGCKLWTPVQGISADAASDSDLGFGGDMFDEDENGSPWEAPVGQQLPVCLPVRTPATKGKKGKSGETRHLALLMLSSVGGVCTVPLVISKPRRSYGAI
jgi:hypothetical protein